MTLPPKRLTAVVDGPHPSSRPARGAMTTASGVDLNGLTFGDHEDPESRRAFWAGWNYRAEHWPTEGEWPSAKDMDLYPDSQTLRVDWERGWLAADAAFGRLTMPGPAP